MISILDAPFLTEKTMKKVDKIKKKIYKKNYNSGICAITLAANGADVFDIIPLYNFKFRADTKEDILIIGLAENKKAAIKMCSRLASEYLKSDRTATMREYFRNMLFEK